MTTPGDHSERIVIVGAGHAGGAAAIALRQGGFAGAITLVGAEPLPPYQRPPLSKAWLKGEAGAADLFLKPAGWYAENGVDLRAGRVATAIDRASRLVRLGDGEAVAYDRLVLATGARARPLPIPGADAAGVFVLRSAADAEALKSSLGPGRRLAVIGGGYVGLEVAASARALGGEAVVIEREARILARVASAPLSAFFQSYHEARGVAFVCGAQAAEIDGRDGRVRAIRLADGRSLPCDAVLIGIGAVPNDDLARAAGLECADGVVVDLQARTSDPDIFAIGDLTWRPVPRYGQSCRLESVPSALEQARQMAAAVTGRAPPAPEIPWFWSDQYDIKLQIAGLPFDADRIVVRGDSGSARFAIFHLGGPPGASVVQAVEAVNAPAEFMAGKPLIAGRTVFDDSLLADTSVPMKSFLR